MRFVQVETPDGPAYIDPRMVAAIGAIWGQPTVRTLYFQGGGFINILDTGDNMSKVLR